MGLLNIGAEDSKGTELQKATLALLRKADEAGDMHFIDNIEDSPASNAPVRKAEARFLRAFNYFAMVKRYGGVPIITKETSIDAPDEEMYPKRSTEQESYDFIIDELTDIADRLEAKPEAGRAGKGAALTLLSRVALYAGSIQQFGKVALDGLNGIPQGTTKNYYQIAADAAKRVMTECGYSLYKGTAGQSKVEALRDIFLVKDNSEAIMVKRHQGKGGTDGPGTSATALNQTPGQ